MHYSPQNTPTDTVKSFYINAEQIIEGRNVIGLNVQSVMTKPILVSGIRDENGRFSTVGILTVTITSDDISSARLCQSLVSAL
jgi:hypothetical protein